MNVHVRTLPLPDAVRPIREFGASALDRTSSVWPDPVASARVLDRWGMPVRDGSPINWPAPDPVMRFDLPAPDLSRAAVPTVDELSWSGLVDPTHPVTAPDLQAAARVATLPQVEATAWPAPMPGTAVSGEPDDAQSARRSAIAIVGLATVASAIVAGTAIVLALL